jgi:DNA-binding transcriptional regulator YdaS (Cro superfamily)
MELSRSPIEALEAAIAFLGNKAIRLAEAIEVSPQMVSFMRSGARSIPAEKCPLIERLTRGQVRCEELRPDVAWDVLRAHNPGEQGGRALVAPS